MVGVVVKILRQNFLLFKEKFLVLVSSGVFVHNFYAFFTREVEKEKQNQLKELLLFFRDHGVRTLKGNPRITQVSHFHFLAHRTLSLSLSSGEIWPSIVSISFSDLHNGIGGISSKRKVLLSDYLWQDFSWIWTVIINPTHYTFMFWSLLLWFYGNCGKHKTTKMLNLP